MSQSATTSTIAYLRSLPAVRERSQQVYDLGVDGKTKFLKVDESKYGVIVKYCADLIEHSYGKKYASIPPHSRWRHFTTPAQPDLLEPILARWTKDGVDNTEVARRLEDLFVVSVLMDAGAGPTWAYTTQSGERVARSEGLAVATLDMFTNGLFSDDLSQPEQVTAAGLNRLTIPILSEALQISDKNPMAGLEGRCNLLIRLEDALKDEQYFGKSQRPGCMVDYLKGQGGKVVNVEHVWKVVMDGLAPVWPASRTVLNGISLGDAWPCEVLKKEGKDEADAIVPFHKLSQWLTYSLLEPMNRILGWEIKGLDAMTGLPEYRNGGLLMDFGLVTLTEAGKAESQGKSEAGIQMYKPDSGTVIEWRAITVIALDKIASMLRTTLNAPDLTTPQVLEAATWKAGRKVAKERRESGGPPIEIISDGTIF